MKERGWIDLGKKRILNILRKYRITYTRHIEIKISEAGPFNQRVQPVLLSESIKELRASEEIGVISQNGILFFTAPDFGLKLDDEDRKKRFIRWHTVFNAVSRKNELCGLQLEHLIYQAVLSLKDVFTIIGTGPMYDTDKNQLVKPAGAEVLFYNGEETYGDGGLDLFLIHKSTGIPIGIEAKNLREWLYPSSVEIWRMIARATKFKCLPVMAARKIAYPTRAGLFSHCGILGFESQFQYFHPNAQQYTMDRFNTPFMELVQKDGLGFADIKVVNEIPKHFLHYFGSILVKNIEEFYTKFMKYRNVLMEYAIDERLAEKDLRQRKSRYLEFREAVDLGAPDFDYD